MTGSSQSGSGSRHLPAGTGRDRHRRRRPCPGDLFNGGSMPFIKPDLPNTRRDFPRGMDKNRGERGGNI